MGTILDSIIGMELPAGLVTPPPRPSIPETQREEEIFFRPSGSPVRQDDNAIIVQGSRAGIPPITNIEGHAVPSGNPISNDLPAIYGRPHRQDPGIPGEKDTILDALSIRSPFPGSEALITRTGRPISNERAAEILTVHEINEPAPSSPVAPHDPIVDTASQVNAHHPRPSSDTQIYMTGQPVSNESSAAIMTILKMVEKDQAEAEAEISSREQSQPETILDTLVIQKSGDAQIFPGGHPPISNESSGAIMRSPLDVDVPSLPERPNPEAVFYPSEGTVSNDRGIGIVYPRAPGLPGDLTTSPNPNAVLYATGAPISNDLHAGTIHRHDHDMPFPEAHLTALPPGTTISNEKNVSFIPSAAPVAHHMGDLVIQQGGGAPTPDVSSLPPDIESAPRSSFPTLNFGGDVFMAASAPQLSNPDAQILPSVGQPLYADTDHTMGGGGDTTKAPNAENVSFSGQGKIDVGSTEVRSALTGDGTKLPNADNVIFTATADTIGNQESYAGPTDSDVVPSAPVNNRDYNDTVHGAVGKPLKRNVT